ncbi:MAG: hypothetical protein ABFS03_04165 [Chloroflexota bacterium]
MIKVEKINPASKAERDRFIRIPFKIYDNCPGWVPPILIDRKAQLNKKKHPFYEHSQADFFIAARNGEDLGCIAALENRRFNQHHEKRQAQFYLFDCIDDLDAASALLGSVYDWARGRGLNQVVGPKGFGPLDGYGIQVAGFEHRQMMTMMNYNHAYYAALLEKLGFRKEVDFISCYIDQRKFIIPERITRIAERVKKRGNLNVHQFKNKRELRQWAPRIGEAYNRAFINNWEYYPLTENEIDFVVENIMVIADPKLIKIITTKDGCVVGFLFGFHDISAALQRSKGKLFPLGIFDLLLERRRTNWISMNGTGILPAFQSIGGNALLYHEMYNTVKSGQFDHIDMPQVAETAVEMRRDLTNLGGKPYKNHRVFIKDL